MPEDLVPQAMTQIFAVYGPAALPIIGLLLVIKYLLDERKQIIEAHKIEIAAERARSQELQEQLLLEARGNADLAEAAKRALEEIARGNI